MEMMATITNPPAVVPNGENYSVSIGNGVELTLVRNIDFGVVPNTTKPCLFKAGAERILMSMGLCCIYNIEEAYEKHDMENPYFFYRVKCSLFKHIDGIGELHITDGFGSANTNEKSCGRAGKFDLANARLKMARKRAMVDACLTVGQLSNAFAQDIENEDVTGEKVKIEMHSEDDAITPKQVKRLYSIAQQNGLSTDKARKIIKDAGFASSKEITQKDYDKVCEMMKGESK